MQTRGDIAAVADFALNESKVMHRLIGRRIGITSQRAARPIDREQLYTLDEFFPLLAVGDELRD